MNEALPDPPPIDPAAPMIARTERIIIDRPLDAYWDWNQSAKLEDVLPSTESLPGVVGVTQLTPGDWGVDGARRIVHLSDGARCQERVLEVTPEARFRYQVWGYTTSAARPVAYAIGEFCYRALDGGRTEIAWTYAFRLRNDRFPGFLGPFGRWLMKIVFLDRAYAQLMGRSLAAMKAAAEKAA